MLFFKGFSIILGLVLVRITLEYVDSVNYGIWLTISSIVLWVSYFDIGLNNGLRNKFASAKASGNIDLAQRFVSTTYALLSIIFLSILGIILIVNKYIDWASILKLPIELSHVLHLVIIVISINFCFKFILSTINIILIADQKPAFASFISLIEQLSIFIIILILTKTTDGSLLFLTLGLCIAPVFIFFVANIILFTGKYKDVAPKYSKIDFSLTKELFGMGFKFFIVQIAMIIQFNSTNLIIIRSFGASDVAAYNIAFKYFNIISMVLVILVTPLWSSVTEAYVNNDLNWIKKTIRNYQRIILLFLCGGFLMLLVSSHVYKIWLGDTNMKIPFALSFWILIFMISKSYGTAYGMALNGIGSIKIQYYSALFSPILFLGLCYIFIHYLHWGLNSVLISGIIANFNGFLLSPIQYRKVFYENKKGIWIQ